MWSREDLVTSLKSLGLLQDPRVERAFRAISQERFLPEGLASLAYADIPLPVLSAPGSITMPSARCLVSAVGLLEPSPGSRILLAGAWGGFPVALLASITSPRNIVVVERDTDLRTVTAERLRANGLGDARVVSEPPSETFDRILVMDHRRTPLTELVPLLADPGALIARGRGVHDLTFVKTVRRGGDTAQFTFNEAPSRVAAGARGAEHMASVDFGR